MHLNLKKSTIVSFIGFLSLLYTTFVFIKPSSKGVLADDSLLTPTSIGTFFITEEVTENEKCYISSEYKDVVQASGRYVYREQVLLGDINPPIIPIFPPIDKAEFNDKLEESNHLGEISPNASEILIGYRYYYIAEPNGYPKIVEFYDLKNDIDSLIVVLEYLNELAIQKNSSATLLQRNNQILGYIRGINRSYTGLKWGVTAGNIDEGFINYVNDTGHINGINPTEYFASFLSYSQYNVENYGNLSVEYQKTSSNSLFLIDPLTENRKIDLIHFFAALDGTVDNTGGYGGNMIGNKQKELCSWAGDLQQVAVEIYGKLVTGETGSSQFLSQGFEYIMQNSSTASEADIYADIDSYTIAVQHLDLQNILLANAIENYYDITTETFRYMRFQTSLRLVGANYLDDSAGVASSKIYYFLGISLDENSRIYDDMDAIGEENMYLDADLIGVDLFANLRYQDEFPSYRVRAAVAEFFHRFIFYGI